MKIFLINLDRSPDRLSWFVQHNSGLGYEIVRVVATDGAQHTATPQQFSPLRYALYHGKRGNPREVACFLSHVRALHAFLASGESHGLICEDDTLLPARLPALLDKAIQHPSWDVLRLTSLHAMAAVPYLHLDTGVSLAVNFARQTGAGAYVITRRGAERWVAAMLPMTLPLDHDMDRDWWYGTRTVTLKPALAEQEGVHPFPTQILATRAFKLPLWRYLSVFPFRVFNETARFASRLVLLAAGWLHRRP